MTETLCFVLDGTLVRRTRSDAAVLEAVFEQYGIEASDGNLAAATDAFRRAFAAMESEPYRQSMAAAVEASDGDADPDAIADTLRAETYDATAVSEAAPDSLAGLTENSRLAVVADGPRAWQVGKLEHHGLVEQFDAVVSSYEVGSHLPDPAVFERVRQRLPADEYVAVGQKRDLTGARSAGFAPIHYERDGLDLWAAVDALL